MLCYAGKSYRLLTFGEFHFMHHFLCVCMYVYLCKKEKDRGRVNGWIK